MRLFFDLNSQQFTTDIGVAGPIESIEVKRSPLANIEVQFHRNGSVVELEPGASGVFEVKRVGVYDPDPITEALAWVKTGTGETTVYSFTLILINAPLNALLGVNDPVIFAADDTTDLLTSTAHGLVAGNKIQLHSDGTLPAPLQENTDYFVLASGLTANAFKVSLSNGGSAINITDTGTGTHTWTRLDNDIIEVTLMAAMRYIADGQSSESQTLDFTLINDVCREGDVPPSSPALVYAVFLPDINSLSDFKAVPTASLQLGYLVEILIVVGVQLSWLTYRLVTGPVVNPEPGDVEPDDYNALTNDRHWEGAVGPSGPSGRDSGISYKWNTNTTSTDPGSGKLKVNNATLSSLTSLFISEMDDDSNALALLLNTWDDSTSSIRGRLVINDPLSPMNFLVIDITGTRTDNGTWDTFSATYVASGGTLTNNMPVRLFFIAKGDKGDTGSTGSAAGIPYLWSTDTTTTDPTSGKVKVNNATLASATALYISETDNAANALAAYLATFDDGTSTIRGQISLFDPTNAGNFAIFNITGTLTDNGSWDTFVIAHVAHGGSFTNSLPLRLLFIPKGDKGDAGTNGSDGGFKFTFNSATAGDPGSGKYLFNNATFASATQLLISETDGNSNALAAFLATQDDSTSTNRCLVFAIKQGGSAYQSFYITGTITDNGTYDTFSITPISSSGSISNNDVFSLIFIRVGDKGDTGRADGLAYLWNTSTANSDPGAGKIKVNNATISSAISLYINETDNDTNLLSGVLATWDDGSSAIKGRLIIHNPTSPTIFAIFDITGTITDNGDWDAFTISHIASGGSFTNNMPVTVSFIPKGDQGTTTAYLATSTTSFAIGTGSKAFTTAAGLSYSVGARVRIASNAGPSNWMEGIVTAYSSTTLTVLVDLTNGSGTFTDWNINIGGEPGVAGGGGMDYILIRDQKSQGTNGGSFSPGSWVTRDLNTEVSDLGGHATLSSNQITLGDGTYQVRITAPAFSIIRHQARLYDVTNTAVLIRGSSEYSNNNASQTSSVIIGVIVLTGGTTTIRVEHQCESSEIGAGLGFGVSNSFGGGEVYTIAEFWKIA